MSVVRQNFHEESEQVLNQQVQMELYASYMYLAMAAYFDRDTVALPGFNDFFLKMSEEERGHAQKFINYVNKRGGRVEFKELQAPSASEWPTCLAAMEQALALEKQVNQKLIELDQIAEKHGDAHLQDFIEEEFLEEQVDSIKKLGDYIAQLKRVGPGLGEYLFDVHSLGGGGSSSSSGACPGPGHVKHTDSA